MTGILPLPLSMLLVIHTISTFLVPAFALQIPILHHQPAPPTFPTFIWLSTDTCTCQGGGSIGWPLANTTQIIHLSALIYCSLPDPDFPIQAQRSPNSTIHESDLGRCTLLGDGYSSVRVEGEGFGYLLNQQWSCEGLVRVKKGGSLCGVFLGVDGVGKEG